MKLHIAVLPGDGIGPEVTAQAVKVLKAIAMEFGHIFTFEYALIGSSAISKTGSALPDETLEVCKKADAILSNLSEEDRDTIVELISYEDNEAGAHMQVEIFEAYIDEKIGDSILRLKKMKENNEIDNGRIN